MARKPKPKAKPQARSVIQDWVSQLPMMQQTVLFTAIRGPDGIQKEHPVKDVLRWFRRCILLSAMDQRVITTPADPGGGSFTGAAADIELSASMVFKHVDELPHHFFMHLGHAAQIIGYKHPDRVIRAWWRQFYFKFVTDMHLSPEFEGDMDHRLSDNRENWLSADKRWAQMEQRYQEYGRR